MARNIAPQDVTWFLDLNERQRIDLSPPYQRRSVWSLKEKKYFLDTIFNGYPCPPLFLYKSITDKGVTTFHVVDGKQRLETVLSFADNKLAIPIDFPDKTLAGQKFKQLTTDQKKTFWNYQFAVELLDIVDAATVKEIFGRYNRTSKNLEPQELRHAKYDGWFIGFAEDESKKAEWGKLGIATTAKVRRMKDVQFISELMIQILNEGGVIGFDQELIEEYYANYDTPNEFDVNFSEDDFIERFEIVKNTILEIENFNQCITNYAKSSTHFYTLWSILSSEKSLLENSELLAKRFEMFMKIAFEISNSENQLELVEKNGDSYKAPFSYIENARGANTEQPQRLQRFNILKNYLLQ